MAAGADVLLSTSPENVAYTTGFVVPSQPLMRWRHAATVLAADGRQAMVCVDMEETAVREALGDIDLTVWREFGGSAMKAIADVLAGFGMASSRIALERSFLPVRDFEELRSYLPGAEFCAGDQLLSECRRFKTPAELDLIERLSLIADGAIAACYEEVKAGSTEMDMAAALTRAVYEGGAQQFKLMIVGTGERSQLANVGPTERSLKSGDVCRVEIFPVINGYHAGVCRTGVVGDPPPHAEQVYQNLVECRQLVLEAARPGVPARKVYEVFRAKFDELGMPPISFVGHGIGLDLHEPPYLADFDTTVLAPGMVLGVEPLVYRTGYGFGMQIKDMIAVEEHGARVLSGPAGTAASLRIVV